LSALLTPETLADARARKPAFDREGLGIGIVHIGLGGFHRAHQAAFTEDAVILGGGDWGIAGVALQRPDAPDRLAAQGGLYTLEVLSETPSYRIMGILKRALFAGRDGETVLDLIAAPATHVVSMTVTEKGYALDSAGALDLAHPDVAHDLAHPAAPRSMVGWLAAGLSRRMRDGAGPVTVLSCDNLSRNGDKLGRAVATFAEATDPALARWIAGAARFPNAMVDSITPAASPMAADRVSAAIGLRDEASVQREPFAQWVIEDAFAGPRPAWEAAGVEIVSEVAPYERLKLHVLNACHSAMAYLGLPRGFTYVREAVADAEIAGFLEALVAEEIGPALAPLPVAAYWTQVRARFANTAIDFPLAQVAEDGSAKLGQRIFPLLVDNVRTGRPHRRLGAVVRAWLAFAAAGEVKDAKAARLRTWRADGARLEAALADTELFPAPFRAEPAVRAAVEGARG
jgi:fructuronate reductase